MKEDIFVEPQIQEIVEDVVFVERLIDTERAARESFKWVCANILGERNLLISVKVSRNFWVRISKWDVACNLKFTFCIQI